MDARPKHPVSSFLFFAWEWRPKLRAAHPEVGNCEISRKLGVQWASLDAETRAVFEARAYELVQCSFNPRAVRPRATQGHFASRCLLF